MDHDQTYFAEQRDIRERIRLNRQGQILDQVIDILTPLRLNHYQKIADLGCGTGSWVISVARKYPDKRLEGVDIDPGILAFATAQAKANNVSSSVTFHVQDITKSLAFPDNSFDLVTTRLIMGFMRREMWPRLLAECKRILRPGGTLIVVEHECVPSNDAILEQFARMWYTAFYHAGHTFSPPEHHHSYGCAIMLKHLMGEAGFVELEHHAYAVDLSYGSPAHTIILENFIAAMQVGTRFLITHQGATTQEDIEKTEEQMRALIGKKGFCCYWYFLSCQGQKDE
jgi:ubiquinone/menaquinone biosynthesis C-methylase UbiE